MDIISKRYTNFRQFLKDIGLSSNEYVKELDGCSTLIFVSKLRQEIEKFEGDNNEKIESGFHELVEYMNLDLSKYNNDDITKFKRFLLYFYTVSIELY